MSCQRPVSLPTNVRRLDDGGPASDFVFHQRRERLLPSPCFFRNVTTQVRKPSANFLIIQCLVQCVAELVQIGCGVRRGANKANQGIAVNSGSPASLVVGTFGEGGAAFVSCDCIGLERPSEAPARRPSGDGGCEHIRHAGWV